MSSVLVESRRVRSNFTGQAAEYDLHARVQKTVVEHLAQLILAHGGLQGEVLDVGTGTGQLALALCRACPQVRPVLLDFAHGMTCRAAAKVAGGMAVDGDAQALPVRSASVHGVVSASVYQWMNDLAGAFAESFRVLRPGGIFAFALFGKGTLYELRGAHSQALRELHRGPTHFQEFPGVAQVRDALVAGGVRILDLSTANEVEYHPEPAALLRALKRIGARNSALHRPRGLASREVMRRMSELYREQYGKGGSVPSTYAVIYGIARRTA